MPAHLGDLAIVHMYHMSQPVHASLLQQCVHAGDSSSLQDAVSCHFVLPGDLQYETETVHVECMKLLFLLGSQGPELIAIQEGAEGTGSVDLDFGVLSQLVISPFSLCQTGHGRSCFADALVDLHVESEEIRDGGSQID